MPPHFSKAKLKYMTNGAKILRHLPYMPADTIMRKPQGKCGSNIQFGKALIN